MSVRHIHFSSPYALYYLCFLMWLLSSLSNNLQLIVGPTWNVLCQECHQLTWSARNHFWSRQPYNLSSVWGELKKPDPDLVNSACEPYQPDLHFFSLVFSMHFFSLSQHFFSLCLQASAFSLSEQLQSSTNLNLTKHANLSLLETWYFPLQLQP